MRARRRRRIAGASIIGSLLVGLLATGAAAGGPASAYVDDDGLAGPGCDGAGMAFLEIQAALDASVPGTTILVCPGTYAGPLVMDCLLYTSDAADEL